MRLVPWIFAIIIIFYHPYLIVLQILLYFSHGYVEYFGVIYQVDRLPLSYGFPTVGIFACLRYYINKRRIRHRKQILYSFEETAFFLLKEYTDFVWENFQTSPKFWLNHAFRHRCIIWMQFIFYQLLCLEVMSHGDVVQISRTQNHIWEIGLSYMILQVNSMGYIPVLCSYAMFQKIG